MDGSKTSTWRLFDDKDLQVGDLVEFLNSGSKEKFAEAEIINIHEKKFKDIETSDMSGTEKYDTLESMLNHFKVYYGDRVDANTVIKIVQFKLLD